MAIYKYLPLGDMQSCGEASPYPSNSMKSMDYSYLKLRVSLLKRYAKAHNIREKKIMLLRDIIDDIKDYLPISNMPFKPAQLMRVTINKRIPGIGNNRIYEIDHLKNPPSTNVKKYGRCNLIDQSVLYGSFTGLTSSKEMQPEIGDLVTTTTWKLKPNESLKVCPIFYITSLNGVVHNELSFRFKDAYENYLKNNVKITDHSYYNHVMQFLAEAFAKEIPFGNHFDYFLSAYLSDVIFRYPSANIEAIIYPSVQDYLGTSNMAILPRIFNDKFYPESLNEGILTGIYPVITLSGTGSAQNFDLKNGKILWYQD